MTLEFSIHKDQDGNYEYKHYDDDPNRGKYVSVDMYDCKWNMEHYNYMTILVQTKQEKEVDLEKVKIAEQIVKRLNGFDTVIGEEDD